MRRLFAAIALLLETALLSGQALYWEEPRILVADGARFPQAASGGGLVAVVWQEFAGNRVWLSLRTSRDLESWTERRRFAGPFPYQGDQASLFYVAVDGQARLYVAIASTERQTTVMYSTDDGASFVSTIVQAPVTTVAPRLSVRADGTILLFVAYDAREQSSLGIYYVTLDAPTLAEGGTLRRPLQPMAAEQNLVFSFLPSHASLGGRDYVVYQSQDNSHVESNFQLWLRVSDTSGRFTQPPIPLTTASERAGSADLAPDLFDNQRPHLAALQDRLALVWERREAFGPKQIYYMEISPAGVPLRPAAAAQSGQPYVRITENTYECLFPRIFEFRGGLYVMWFDNRRGENHIFVAERDGDLWRERDLSGRLAGNSIYPWFVQSGSGMAVLWESQAGGVSRLVRGGPDQSVDPPRVFAQGFTPGLPSRASRVTLAWTVPEDSAGISGFAWSWSQDPAAAPSRRLMAPVSTTRTTLDAEEDGKWYFSVAALDFAGNWSKPVTVTYERDTEPPARVTLDALPTDARGFLASNSPRVQWKAGDAKPLSGYAYEMVRLSADPGAGEPQTPPAAALAPQVRTQATGRGYDNLDNGLWMFSVAAVDLAGNASEPVIEYLRLNKYVPVTLISSVDWSKDELGRISLSIRGRGFTEDGRVTEIVMDRDGKPPLDQTWGPDRFRIVNNGLIEGITLTNYDEGSYRVGVVHSRRGMTLTPPLITLDAFGTVKLGDFTSASYTTPWEAGTRPSFTVSAERLLVWLLMAFLAFALVASAGRVFAVAREARELREQVFAVVSGVAVGKEKLMRELKSRGMGLRVKFTLLIVVLVILVVLMISVPLSISAVRTQTKNLAEGLEQRAHVLLGSISAAAAPFIIDQDPLSLDNLTNQIAAMREAEYATITGITPRGSDRPGSGEEYVWASNDKDIGGKIGGGELQPGLSLLKDEVSPALTDVRAKVQSRAETEVGSLVQELEKQLKDLEAVTGVDAASRAQKEQIGKSAAGLESRINRQLRAIAGDVGSLPEFRYDQLDTRYVFFQPIVFRVRDSDIYFRGLVRLSVSATAILKEIEDTTRNLIGTIGLIALGAIGLGAIGALILASITIGPIRRLAEGVATIRDTENKEDLKDHRIEIRQKDEIRLLADTINEMTQGLVKAAIADHELKLGKDIQKMFLPLTVDASGRKGATGQETNEAVDIFGYYEGAKDVSGDYFDYKRLDPNHYALIKVDVSGKGVSAALIMIEVATIFQTYFKHWTLQNPGLRIDRFAYEVNDMLEERGFKGRFATLMVALVNIRTGVCVMVNAGDNIVHIYSAREKRMVLKKHPNPPAAGVFPSILLETKSAYVSTTEKLEPGDTLFLMTDGIEEAQRLFRDTELRPFELEQEEQVEEDGQRVTLPKGTRFEQLGIPRAQHIVSAVFGRGTYELRKLHDPTPDEKYEFDFTSCRGSVEEAVLALIAVEKVFRMYLDPSAGSSAVIYVDRKIDAFLKEHFRQYSLYFGRPVAGGGDTDHAAYSHVREDSQYDDLTILAIRRK